MKIIVQNKVEVEVKTLRINITAYYKDIPADFPFTKRVPDYGRRLCIDIDIDTGVIRKWPKGHSGELRAKISDEGSYYLLDENNEEVAFLEREYVPNKIIPPIDGFGKYIHLNVDENGKITNWYEKPDIYEFTKYDNYKYDDED